MPHQVTAGFRRRARALTGPAPKYLVSITWRRSPVGLYSVEDVDGHNAWLTDTVLPALTANVDSYDATPAAGTAKLVFSRSFEEHFTREPCLNQAVVISQYYGDTEDACEVFSGHLSGRPVAKADSITIYAVSGDMKHLDQKLPVRTVTRTEFPRAPDETQGVPLPLVIGEVEDYPPLLLDAPVVTTLARDLTGGKTEIAVADASLITLDTGAPLTSVLGAAVSVTKDELTLELGTDFADWPDECFFLILNDSERVYVDSRSGLVCSGVIRGLYGTAPAAYLGGESVEVWMPLRIGAEDIAYTYRGGPDLTLGAYWLQGCTRGLNSTDAVHHRRGEAVRFMRPRGRWLACDAMSYSMDPDDAWVVDTETGRQSAALSMALETDTDATDFPGPRATAVVEGRAALQTTPCRASSALENGESWTVITFDQISTIHDREGLWSNTANIIDGDTSTYATLSRPPTYEDVEWDAVWNHLDPHGEVICTQGMCHQ